MYMSDDRGICQAISAASDTNAETVAYLIDESSSFNCEFSPLNSCTGEEYSLHYVIMTSLIILALLKIELHVGTSDTP